MKKQEEEVKENTKGSKRERKISGGNYEIWRFENRNER